MAGFREGGWDGECGGGIRVFPPMNQRTIHGWGTLLVGWDTKEQKQKQVPFGFGPGWLWGQQEWEEDPCSLRELRWSAMASHPERKNKDTPRSGPPRVR
jgi:hypothetical protein